MIGIQGHFRTQFPLSASGKPAVGLFLRRRPLYPAELRDHVPETLYFQGFPDFEDFRFLETVGNFR